MTAFSSLFTALGPVFAGIMHDWLGDYTLAYLIFAGVNCLAALLVLLIRPPGYGRPSQRPPVAGRCRSGVAHTYDELSYLIGSWRTSGYAGSQGVGAPILYTREWEGSVANKKCPADKEAARRPSSGGVGLSVPLPSWSSWSLRLASGGGNGTHPPRWQTPSTFEGAVPGGPRLTSRWHRWTWARYR
jgi:hypothetical protein